MGSLSSVKLVKSYANTPTVGKLKKERDGTTKSINLDSPHLPKYRNKVRE